MDITPQDLKKMMDEKQDFVLLDIREEEEYNIAHIEGCKNIPMSQLTARLPDLNPDDLIVAYCHHGMRSFDCASFLQQSGFENVKSLAGGIDRWSLEIDASVPRY